MLKNVNCIGFYTQPVSDSFRKAVILLARLDILSSHAIIHIKNIGNIGNPNQDISLMQSAGRIPAE